MTEIEVEYTLKKIQKLEDTAVKRKNRLNKALIEGQAELAQYIKERLEKTLSEGTRIEVLFHSYKVTFKVDCENRRNRYMDIDLNINTNFDDSNKIKVGDTSLSVDSLRYGVYDSDFDYITVAGEIASSMKNNRTMYRKIVNTYTSYRERVNAYESVVAEANDLLTTIKTYTTNHLVEQLVLGYKVGDKFNIDDNGGTALIKKVQNKTVTCEWYAYPQRRRYRYNMERKTKRIDKYTLAKIIVVNANSRTKKMAETVLDASIYRLNA
jgi:hypothetical protein